MEKDEKNIWCNFFEMGKPINPKRIERKCLSSSVYPDFTPVLGKSQEIYLGRNYILLYPAERTVIGKLKLWPGTSP